MYKKKKYTHPTPPKPCQIVNTANGATTDFPSRTAAGRALAALISTLPPRKPGEQKRYIIRNK